MKKALKAVLRPFWRLSGPIRRPVARRIEDWFFLRVEPRARKLSGEIVPGLDGLLRELARLQSELDRLQDALADAHAEGPSVVERARAS
jgi:hypothetical protein